MRREHGMPVVPYVKKQGLFDAKVLAAHCVHIWTKARCAPCTMPARASPTTPPAILNWPRASRPSCKMLDLGLNVGIGTDGPASNNDLDMFAEDAPGGLPGQGHQRRPNRAARPTGLAMATRLGAQALHIGHLTGSLEAGKRADLILVDI